jgi:hypothetical protein
MSGHCDLLLATLSLLTPLKHNLACYQIKWQLARTFHAWQSLDCVTSPRDSVFSLFSVDFQNIPLWTQMHMGLAVTSAHASG